MQQAYFWKVSPLPPFFPCTVSLPTRPNSFFCSSLSGLLIYPTGCCCCCCGAKFWWWESEENLSLLLLEEKKTLKKQKEEEEKAESE